MMTQEKIQKMADIQLYTLIGGLVIDSIFVVPALLFVVFISCITLSTALLLVEKLRIEP